MRVILIVLIVVSACHKKAPATSATGPQTVTVTLEGGEYEVLSIPPGVQCVGGACSGTFEAGTRITLRGAMDFPLVDFTGPCEQRYVHTCTFVVSGPIAVTATFHAPAGN